jgi:hypothetical protein
MPQRSWTAERQRPYQHLRPAMPMGHQSNGTHASGQDNGRTYDELYEEAKRRNIKGRSKMSKTELERALG